MHMHMQGTNHTGRAGPPYRETNLTMSATGSELKPMAMEMPHSAPLSLSMRNTPVMKNMMITCICIHWFCSDWSCTVRRLAAAQGQLLPSTLPLCSLPGAPRASSRTGQAPTHRPSSISCTCAPTYQPTQPSSGGLPCPCPSPHLETDDGHPDYPEDVAAQEADKYVVLVLNLPRVEHVEHLHSTQQLQKRVVLGRSVRPRRARPYPPG